MPARTPVLLVRHGEVRNPRHLVYADLPGFPLTTRGRAQAEAAAAHLSSIPVAAVLTSPLRRARETAAAIAAPHRLVPVVEEQLTEWRLSSRWAGRRWEELPTAFPGELEAYLDHPRSLPFAPESLAALAERVAGVLRRNVATAGGALVVVSHQDPIQAARILLTGRSWTTFGVDKPGHATVLHLEAPHGRGRPWQEIARWDPPGPLLEHG